ncbi:uncharacterized protein LOC110241160 [Exaiptasia diaphana]|uniref:G-protein coupled receptors family 1 profile domain-containing protein n=1 Tax=Exaiptasia diaphana TaxID=2652724 RepID=A0A913XD61_EXADI|nr:uncharacterized protein LOC110241160 [Exaiptasia diaphana]
MMSFYPAIKCPKFIKLRLTNGSDHELFTGNFALGVCHSIASVPTALINCLLLLAISKTPSLHLPSYVFLANMSMSDTIVGLFVHPLLALKHFSESYNNISIGCALFKPTLAVMLLVGCVSLLNGTAISIDRFLAISLGLKYRTTVTIERVVKVVIMFWFMAFVGVGCYLVTPGVRSWGRACSIWVLLCLVLIIIFYGKAYYKLSRYNKTRAQHISRVSVVNERESAVTAANHPAPRDDGQVFENDSASRGVSVVAISSNHWLPRNGGTEDRVAECSNAAIDDTNSSNIDDDAVDIITATSNYYNQNESNYDNNNNSTINDNAIRSYRERNYSPNPRVNVSNNSRRSVCEDGGHANIEVYRGTLTTMVFVVSILLVCYTPLLISSIYCSVKGLNDTTFYIVHYLAVFFALFNSFMNSVLCLWRVHDIRKAVFKVSRSIVSRWICYRMVSSRRRAETVETVIVT